MKLNKLALFAPLTLALAINSNLQAAPVLGEVAKTESVSAKVSKRYNSPLYQINRDENGERWLDMTNKTHYQFAKSRLKKANINPLDFPQLHKSLDELKHQQILAKSQPIDVKQSANKTVENSALITHAHMFLNKQVVVSPEDGKAYLTIGVESSVFGGTNSTYVDLLLEDENFGQLAPIASKFEVLEGKKTQTEARVSLDELKANFPNLDRIYASSWVETEDVNGELSAGVRLVEYPWDWQAIEAQYGAYMEGNKSAKTNVIVESGGYRYTGIHPVDGANAANPVLDGMVKVCLNRAHSDCDYTADQYAQSNSITDVNIPFQGQLIVPHRILEIYDSTLHPNGVDEPTNIYMQEGVYGGATKLSYRSMAGVNHFSDYVDFMVDDSDPNNLHTVITWNVPRSHGRFGNALLFSNIAHANLRMTFAVRGYSYFKGRAGNFMIQINSEQVDLLSNNHIEALPKIRLGYSCLARGTMITMADGSEKAIEDILNGDLVLGAATRNAETAQPMKVVDTSIGIEALKMFNIQTQDGKEILMTETHPVSTSNKGMIWAKELKKGDRILTEDGSALVTQIKQKQYKDNVFNLKLAPVEGSKIAEGENLGMFANGMLVGDLKTQNAFNYKDQFIRQSNEEKLQRMPEKWKTDFISSLK